MNSNGIKIKYQQSYKKAICLIWKYITIFYREREEKVEKKIKVEQPDVTMKRELQKDCNFHQQSIPFSPFAWE